MQGVSLKVVKGKKTAKVLPIIYKPLKSVWQANNHFLWGGLLGPHQS